jgi:hypothetical protein
MNGASIGASSTAYLDALDEYRSGENSKDKLPKLASAITASGVSRWRLTCRAEDWRSTADISAMRKAANNQPITVARLLSLNREEARSVLAALGEAEPRRFADEALTRGAGAFLESPLSLRLLQSAVRKDGIWPDSRFDLFRRAIDALAHEYNPEREYDPRPAVDEIVQASELLCFYMLAAGATAFWRSNALPIGDRSSDYVPIQSLSINHALARSSLDTAIFRGEGQRFEPIHRTIAEFLAGRFLARKVLGGPNEAQFPLQRATALITSYDHKAPSELRGLYAWFAAHLARLGDQTGAITLVERDAATVLAYGDAAAFTTDGRKAILFNLDSDDPYFLSASKGTTVFGGLAGQDLAPDFINILDSKTDSHLQVTVLQALEEGVPVAAMQPKLRQIALDDKRPLWQRGRAASAWIKGSNDQSAARSTLYRELTASPVTPDQISLRSDLLAEIVEEDLPVSDVVKLISDLNTLRATDRDDPEPTGLTINLLIALKKSPHLSELFKKPILGRSRQGVTQKLEVRHFLQQTLAVAISATPNLSAAQLWSWLKNIRDCEWDRLEEELASAITKWIDEDLHVRELELFLTLAEDCRPDEGPWMATNHYMSIARRVPSETLLGGLLATADREHGRRRRRLFEIAAYAARSENYWPAWKERIISALQQEGNFDEYINSLELDPNREWKEQERQRKKKEDAETDKARARNIAELEPNINEIAAGVADQFGTLNWAANLYRNAAISRKGGHLSKIERFTNERIASAIAEGFIKFAIHTDIKVIAADLGKAEAQNQGFRQEYVVAAGVHQALSQGREDELAGCPLVNAIVALRQNYFSGDEKPGLSDWAIQRLACDPEAGANELLNYWNAALDAGDTNLDSVHYLMTSSERELCSRTFQDLLLTRPNLPTEALKQALIGIATSSSRDEVLKLAIAAQAVPTNPDADKLWNFISLALEPSEFEATHSIEQIRSALLAPNGELANRLQALSSGPCDLDRMRIAILGLSHPAEERDWARTGNVSQIVRAAINRLSESPGHDAGQILNSLAPAVDASWKPILAHAASEHARLIRDSLFEATSVADLKRALDGGPPANPADLAAVVLEELHRYRRTLRTGSETPWKRYWNTDENGFATRPQIENEDRDRLLELLRPRLDRYGIAASLPEARRAENTRVDILLISHAGKNLPIEAKRHYNNELWTAPVEQLGGYAADEGAFGYGIYLVFWFGAEFPTPARKDRKVRPTTAAELEELLQNDLPLAMQNQISIIVLDVSRPEAMITATQRDKKPRKRAAKPSTLQ